MIDLLYCRFFSINLEILFHNVTRVTKRKPTDLTIPITTEAFIRLESELMNEGSNDERNRKNDNRRPNYRN